MNICFLPEKIRNAFELCDSSVLYEIRFRVGFPIILKSFLGKFYLGEKGKTILADSAYICSKRDIEEIIENATEHSVYAFNEEIKQGFITASGGLRIGVCGDCVYDGEKLVTIKNISSLNIRIPHEVNGCSKPLCKYLLTNKISSTLIISPPAKGKTTILKDIARKINSLYNYSVLIIDERGEFGCVSGENIDKICYSDKLFAFNYALRSMSPDLVITDELSGRRDWQCAEEAFNSGIKIFASMHGIDIDGVVGNKCFIKGIFDRYVVVYGFDKIGLKFNIYDREFNELCE